MQYKLDLFNTEYIEQRVVCSHNDLIIFRIQIG